MNQRHQNLIRQASLVNRAALIAADVQANAREILEAIYPGYRLENAEVKYSDFVAGAYIYARLRRRTPSGSRRQ